MADATLSDLTEDFTKATFDFWRGDGSQVDTVAELSAMTAQTPLKTAAWLSNYPFPEALPPGLFEEAQRALEQG